MPREYNFTDEDRLRSRTKEQARRDRIAELPRQWSKEDKDLTLSYFDWQCGYCETPETDVTLEFDHFIDLYDEECPGTVVGNMIPACRSCNRKKGNLGAETIVSEARFKHIKTQLCNLGASWLD